MGQDSGREVISSSGDSFSNSTYRLDWSLGGAFDNTTSKSGDYELTQGFQQAVVEITEVNNFVSDIQVSVYPNPATDFVNIEVEDQNYAGMTYTVSSTTSGDLVKSGVINTNIEQVYFSDLANGIYILRIFDNNTCIKTIKLQKI